MIIARKNWIVSLAAGVAAVAATFSAASMQPEAESRPATPKIGDAAPDFTLKDTDGKEHKLSTYTSAGKTVVIEWFNPDCPYVVKHHKSNKTMAETARKYKDRDVVWIAVNSGKPGKQGTGLDRNIQAKRDYEIAYPILLDETSGLAVKYGAKRTPTMAIISKEGKLVYMGAIDNNNSPTKLGDINYVDRALSQHLGGETVEFTTSEAYGCGIKF